MLKAMRLIHAALLMAAIPGAASADDGWVTAANSHVRLSWCGAAVAGKASAPEFAFLEMQLEPGWKTYWRVPGEAGVPPSFEWADTVNVGKATVLYPAPHRLTDQGGKAIGYKSTVTFPIRIERRVDAEAVGLAVQAEYGICKNICVPVDVKLTAACHGAAPSDSHAAALEAVPRAPGHARATDPRLVAVSGSVTATPAKLVFDVDFGAGADATDLFIEAPGGAYVPLPARATPDARGRARFVVDLSKTSDAKDLAGQVLRLTMVGSKGAAEALWTAH